jgi:hypothetical protein
MSCTLRLPQLRTKIMIPHSGTSRSHGAAAFQREFLAVHESVVKPMADPTPPALQESAY